MLGQSIHRRLLDASTEVMVVLLDLEGRIVYASAGARSVLGFEPEELLGRRADEVVAPGLAAEARISFDVILQGRSLRHRRGLARRADGLHAHVRFDATPLPGDDGKIEGVVVTAQLADRDLVSPDATASETPNEERTGGEGAGELIERLPAVVYVAEPGPEGPWLYVSQQIEQLLGYEREQWLSDPTMWANRVHPDDLESVLASEDEDLAGTSTSFETEYRMVTRDGRIVWVRDEAVLRRDHEGRPRYDGLLIDVTDRKRIESQLQFFAEHDHLTGLRNRRRFLDELDLEIRRGRRHDEPVSVLMLDLDKLKDVNDSLGHSAGDSLIRATAEALALAAARERHRRPPGRRRVRDPRPRRRCRRGGGDRRGPGRRDPRGLGLARSGARADRRQRRGRRAAPPLHDPRSGPGRGRRGDVRGQAPRRRAGSRCRPPTAPGSRPASSSSYRPRMSGLGASGA